MLFKVISGISVEHHYFSSMSIGEQSIQEPILYVHTLHNYMEGFKSTKVLIIDYYISLSEIFPHGVKPAGTLLLSLILCHFYLHVRMLNYSL